MKEIKDQLVNLVVKVLVLLQSRKFWATVVSIATVAHQMSINAISPEVGIAAIVSTLIAYMGLMVTDDYLTRKLDKKDNE